MIVLFRSLIITYIVAINVYGFLLIFFQKKQTEEQRNTLIKDGKLIIAAMLGGGFGVYLSMFVFSYRLQSLFLMILIPIITVINVYIIIVGFTGNFGFLVQGNF